MERNETTLTTDERIAQLEQFMQQQSQENDALKKQLSQKDGAEPEDEEKPPVVPTDKIEVNGEIYEFIHAAFWYGGKKVSALDALHDNEIMLHLVETGSGLIRRVS